MMKTVKPSLAGVTTVLTKKQIDANPEINLASKTVINSGNPSLFAAQQLQDLHGDMNIPSRLKFTLDNSADSVNVKNFLLFDIMTLVYDQLAAKPTHNVASDTLTYAQLAVLLSGGTLSYNAMKLEATVSETQFNNDIIYYTGNFDGLPPTGQKIHPSDAVNGSQYDRKIQNYKLSASINKTNGLFVPVAASEKLYVTLFFEGISGL